MLESLIDVITPWFEEWGLLIILVATFLESSVLIASVLPGESVLLLGGFFASPHSPVIVAGADPPLELGMVILVAFLGAVLGDLAGYVIGRTSGDWMVRKFGRFFFLPEGRIPVLRSYFERYGMRAVLLGRFAPFLRSVRTLVAGMARMPIQRFILPDVVGSLAWAAAIAAIGYVLGESWTVAKQYLGAFGAVIFLLLAVLFLMTWRRVRARVERELGSSERSATTESH